MDPVAFGVLKNEVDGLRNELADTRKDVKELLALANRSRGAIWLGMVLAGGLGAVIHWLAGFIPAGKGG